MNDLIHPAAAVVDAGTGTRLAGEDLRRRVEQRASDLRRHPAGLCLIALEATEASVVDHLGAMSSGRPVVPLPVDTPAERWADLVARYRPALVLDASGSVRPEGCEEVAGGTWRGAAEPAPVHPDLAMCLTTSGSTGSPKLVRLSRSGLLHNVDAIRTALDVRPTDVAVTSLPLNYSYGLSVLHSHVRAGATTVLTTEPFTSRAFWDVVDREGVTSFAGVPQHYKTLLRLRFDPRRHPALRTWTQAGGRLHPSLVQEFTARLREDDRFYVMYGQTEAGPRITTLPADDLARKLGSVGPALSGGSLSVLAEDGSEVTTPGVRGEVVYRGPNVMMGYAVDATGLERPDEVHGVLRTGDIGSLDSDGYLVLSGRAARSGKVFGTRVNLDDLEGLVQELLPSVRDVAVTAGDDVVRVHVVPGDEPGVRVDSALAEATGLPRSGFDVHVRDELPRLASGKPDYSALTAEPVAP